MTEIKRGCSAVLGVIFTFGCVLVGSESENIVHFFHFCFLLMYSLRSVFIKFPVF